MVMRTMGAAIASRSNRFAEVPLERGVTAVVPASVIDDAILRCGPDTRALIARPA